MTVERAMILVGIISAVVGIVGAVMIHATREPRPQGRHRIQAHPRSSFLLGLQVIACWIMGALPRPYIMKGF